MVYGAVGISLHVSYEHDEIDALFFTVYTLRAAYAMHVCRYTFQSFLTFSTDLLKQLYTSVREVYAKVFSIYIKTCTRTNCLNTQIYRTYNLVFKLI
jgi:hypothetical protein